MTGPWWYLGDSARERLSSREERVKVLTLTEPWATLVAIGAKHIETRSWTTSYRGPLMIHAAKGMPKWAEMTCYDEPFFSTLRDHFNSNMIRQAATNWFPRGQIIASCELADIQPTEHIRGQITDQERAFGDYTAGRFAWILVNMRRLSAPIPARGSLGLWEWQPEVVAA
jgi:activating signal cointegrator 1